MCDATAAPKAPLVGTSDVTAPLPDAAKKAAKVAIRDLLSAAV